MKNRIKEYRERANLTQSELAEMSDVSRNTISSLENGTNINVTYQTMIKIATALEEKVTTIFFDEKAQNIVHNITKADDDDSHLQTINKN